MKISHFIYVGCFFNYKNDWIRPVKSPNFIKNEISYFNSVNEVCAIIFPSGGTIYWKSGFYYLAKLTDTPIYIAHINYIDNKIKIIDRIETANTEYDTIKNKCLYTFKKYIKIPWWSQLLNLFGYGDECMM